MVSVNCPALFFERLLTFYSFSWSNIESFSLFSNTSFSFSFVFNSFNDSLFSSFIYSDFSDNYLSYTVLFINSMAMHSKNSRLLKTMTSMNIA